MQSIEKRGYIILGSIILIVSCAFLCIFYVGYKEQTPSERERSVKESQDDKLIEIKAGFISDCAKKFPVMEEGWTSLASTKDMAQQLVKTQRDRCNKADYFDLNSPFYCKNHILEAHTEETYVEQCINWRLQLLTQQK